MYIYVYIYILINTLFDWHYIIVLNCAINNKTKYLYKKKLKKNHYHT